MTGIWPLIAILRRLYRVMRKGGCILTNIKRVCFKTGNNVRKRQFLVTILGGEGGISGPVNHILTNKKDRGNVRRRGDDSAGRVFASTCSELS
jgi:hypothetical protein